MLCKAWLLEAFTVGPALGTNVEKSIFVMTWLFGDWHEDLQFQLALVKF